MDERCPHAAGYEEWPPSSVFLSSGLSVGHHQTRGQEQGLCPMKTREHCLACVLGRGTVAGPRVLALGTTTRFLILLFSSTAGNVHPPSTSMATSSQYRQLLSDYGPPSLGYTQVR